MTLRHGTPAEAGLAADGVARLVPAVEPFLGGPEPSCPGFVLLAARHGVVVAHEARGLAVRYGARDGRVVELPEEARVPMRPDTVFDLASLSKVFTAVVAVCLAERGVLDLDAPVSRYLAGFPPVAVRRLLTHTGGFAPEMDLGPFPDRAARLAAVAAQPPGPPGYRYSDLGLIAVGAACEAAAGRQLDELVGELITGPLGLADTGYRPPAGLLPRIAATEYQPWTGRGVVRGTVHDENAYHLGGVAGHAGIFSTAADLAVLGQMMLNGGRYGGVTVLGERWVREMLTNHNGDLGRDAARGLGWQLDQPGWMGELASPTAFGHAGYTGTSLVADPAAGVLLVLLTNRVHPTRDRGTDSAYRRAPARELARAVRNAPTGV
ncbi:serine hydrolase domain-containing protein [Streptomyces litchfieldiae]|uniref:Serine hydrolase domain-containing protein n=1 Tax=Streptomyces litchfieldiae TaxID=3075543 RepID=A0ABU2MPA2_9ACTN|nr:serine hydrolase domain-containing protein [Streptomyces sp. DSM 44938]MDT0343429.1 serine hydrolase domain-containing protein [Streptomyces sp. DSM 44938]